MKKLGTAALAALAVAGCATTTTPTKPAARVSTPPTVAVAPQPEAPIFTLASVTFAELPGWSQADLQPALAALRRSCAAYARRPDDTPMSRQAPYGGTVGDWRPACAAAAITSDARWLFETYFTPNEVRARADQMRKVTGYYEPVVEARRSPAPGFSEPFLAKPADLIDIDLGQFDTATDLSNQIADDLMKNIAADLPDSQEAKVRDLIQQRLARRLNTSVRGRLTADRRIEPFPKREGLDYQRGVLGYGQPCDVYDVQVQGSARVRFEDGVEMRMAYASQNGWKWQSIYSQMRDRGYIASPTKPSVCAWMSAQTPEAARGALNLDPSYVFFALEPIGDPAAGPRGAQGVPLTPLGSAAIDPAAHPYGAVLFVDGTGPDGAGGQGTFRRLLVAQDTGGAIRRGPLRADVFFGTGAGAGALATQMNAPARFWTLIPKPFAPSAQIAGAGAGTVATAP